MDLACPALHHPISFFKIVNQIFYDEDFLIRKELLTKRLQCIVNEFHCSLVNWLYLFLSNLLSLESLIVIY